MTANSESGVGGKIWIASSDFTFTEHGLTVSADGTAGGEVLIRPKGSMQFSFSKDLLGRTKILVNLSATRESMTFTGDGNLTISATGTSGKAGQVHFTGALAIIPGAIFFDTTSSSVNSTIRLIANGVGAAENEPANIHISVEGLQLNGPALIAEANAVDSGDGGRIHIQTFGLSNLTIGSGKNKMTLSAIGKGDGDGGQVHLATNGDLTVDGNALSVAPGTGAGGSITLLAEGLSNLVVSGNLRANGGLNGNAGHIQISGTSVELLNNAFIQADGGAGVVSIEAKNNLTFGADSKITANHLGELGVGGQITIAVQDAPLVLDGSVAIESKVSPGTGLVGGFVHLISSTGLITLGTGTIVDSSGGALFGTVQFSSIKPGSSTSMGLTVENNGIVVTDGDIRLTTVLSDTGTPDNILVSGNGEWHGVLTGRGNSVSITNGGVNQVIELRNLEAGASMVVSATGTESIILINNSSDGNPTLISGGVLTLGATSNIVINGVIDSGAGVNLNTFATGDVFSETTNGRIQSAEMISFDTKGGIGSATIALQTTSATQLKIVSGGDVNISHTGTIELFDCESSGQLFRLEATGDISVARRDYLSVTTGEIRLISTGGNIGTSSRAPFKFNSLSVSFSAAGSVWAERVPPANGVNQQQLLLKTSQSKGGDFVLTSDVDIVVGQSQTITSQGNLTLHVADAAGTIELGAHSTLLAPGEITLYMGSLGNPKPFVGSVIQPTPESGTIVIQPSAIVRIPGSRLDQLVVIGSNQVNSGTTLIMNPGRGGSILFDGGVTIGTPIPSATNNVEKNEVGNPDSHLRPVSFVHWARSHATPDWCVSTAQLPNCMVKRLGDAEIGLAKDGSVVVTRGEILAFAAGDVCFRIGDCSVQLHKGAVVNFVVRDSQHLEVRNLVDRCYGQLVVIYGNHSLKMSPGQELIFSNRFATRNHYPVRLGSKVRLADGLFLSSSHFSLPAFLSEHKVIQALIRSSNTDEKRLVEPIVKMAACIMHATQSRGPYTRN